ncbi:PspC domain-containing protein [Hymenobacter sp. B81]|uniref:PspC domain-containing protein n=1 Tax=Hymenobacter sp. B81 TaxID=3344878 RepID=UPI0037DBFFF7
MKKNISINLQGLIFHIEEDGYEVLQRYLQDVKAHFSTYRGHEEIVADIESRIAELFAARLSTTKQVISLEDVEAMVAKMGRVQEFQQDGSLDEDEDVADVNNYGRPVGAGPAAQATGAGSSSSAPADGEPRRLYRDMANRKIAGVCAGLARYFGIEALWVRLIFLVFLIALPILFDSVGADQLDEQFPFWTVLSYIILWIALPKRYDGTPESQDDPTFKKLFRDTDNGKVGGVSAGLAAYFKIDVVLVRILFIIFVFAGGFAIPLYIVLWILVPEAKTVGDKMRMRGDALTLSSLDETARNNAFEAGYVGTNATNRPVGAFLEELARNLRPLVNLIGTIIRWFAAALLIVVGFSLLIGLAVLAGVALGLIPESNNIILGDAPAYAVLAGLPWWMVASAFLASVIPVLLLLLLGIGLIARRSVVTRTVGLSLLGLWLLGVVGSVMGGVRLAHDFQEEGSYTAERNLGRVNYPTVLLRTRELGSDWDLRPQLMITAADSGAAISLSEEYVANGATEAAGAATARATMQFNASVRDSSVVIDDQFRYKPGAIYRSQDLNLTLRLPRDKQYRLSEDFAYLLNEGSFVDGQRPNNPEQHLYRLRGNELECIDCAPGDIESEEASNEDPGEDDFEVNVNGERVRISVGDEGPDTDVSFSTAAEDYGSARRTFSLDDFNRVSVAGAYRVVLRKGNAFRVQAAGTERSLKDLEVRVQGDELIVRPRRQGLMNNWNNRNAQRVLVEIELPGINTIDLSGAVQAKATGFENQGNLRIEQSGASHLQFEGSCRALTVELTGACQSVLEGQANTLRLEGTGACQIQAADLQVATANVELSGVSKARLHVTDKLDADVSGASEVRYSGNPTNVRTDDSGAASVKRVE